MRAGDLGDVAGLWKGRGLVPAKSWPGAGLGAVGWCPDAAALPSASCCAHCSWGSPRLGLAMCPSSVGLCCLKAAGFEASLAQGSLKPSGSPHIKLKQVNFFQNTLYLEMKIKLKKKNQNQTKTNQLQHQ